MPLLRNTRRRALEGLPPTMPSTASISSLPTGSSGRNDAVRVRNTSMLIQVHPLDTGTRWQVELLLQYREAPPHERAQQRLDQQTQRHHRQNQSNQKRHIQKQERVTLPLPRFAHGAQQLAPQIETARGGLFADQQVRIGIRRLQAGEQRRRTALAILPQRIAQRQPEAARRPNAGRIHAGRRQEFEEIFLAREQPE